MQNDIGSPWERATLEKLLFTTIKEQRIKRRWGIFFRLLFWSYLFALLYLIWPNNSNLPIADKSKPHVALIDIASEIGDHEPASADNIISGMHAAFKNPLTQAILLRINSPGGSPVQASMIYHDILWLRQHYPKIKVYAACTDVCASAAYYIATSADYIYADGASLVGSIGAAMDSFGFVDTMKKLGVERRLIHTGMHKSFLDPFTPARNDEMQYAQSLVNSVAQQFIQSVIQSRGKRLKSNADTFTGLVWTGEMAVKQGLIDGIASPGQLLRDILKNEYVIDYTVKGNYWDLLANRIGSFFNHSLGSQFHQPPGIYKLYLR